jgi:hypothetical protein
VESFQEPESPEDQMIRRLRNTVEELARCLREHLTSEAELRGVSTQELCPCWTHELARADTLIQELKGMT